MKTIHDFDEAKMKQIIYDIEGHFGWAGFLVFMSVIYNGQSFKFGDVGRTQFKTASKKLRALASTLERFE